MIKEGMPAPAIVGRPVRWTGPLAAVLEASLFALLFVDVVLVAVERFGKFESVCADANDDNSVKTPSILSADRAISSFVVRC